MESKHTDPFLSQGAGQVAGSQPLPQRHGGEVRRFGAMRLFPVARSFQARADGLGNGRWVDEAVEPAVHARAVAATLFARFASRREGFPSLRALAIVGNQVWGHSVHAATTLARQPCARRGSQ